MNPPTIRTNFSIDIYGFSGIAVNRDYGGTAFKLMDKMWPVVKAEGLKSKGQNVWVYEPGDMVFAGIELENISPDSTGLEQKSISLTKYAYYKHIGPYSRLKEAGDHMRTELKRMGFETSLPYIEIYGHWDNDETKLETELLMNLK